MKRDIVWTTKFKKDYKLAVKRNLDIGLLDDIIRVLARGETLPEKNRDHELTGDWVGQGSPLRFPGTFFPLPLQLPEQPDQNDHRCGGKNQFRGQLRICQSVQWEEII